MVIIVARYNEDVEWTKQFPNVIIYNKGEPLSEEYNSIQLKNVGREGHTYYNYIYENYENLDDYTIFLQGNPFEHSPNIIKNLWTCINQAELNFYFEFLSEKILYTNLKGCPYHYKLPLIDVYEKIFNERLDEKRIQFGAGAQFIVSKRAIHSNNKEFYLKIIKLLENEINPIEGFVIERFHKLFFQA